MDPAMDDYDHDNAFHVPLDATGEREVVYCHYCSSEWYRDQRGLICPACRSEITEIISPDNDPRPGRPEHPRASVSTSPEINPLPHHDNDSDPDEADIDEHLDQQGFHYRRSTRRGTGTRHYQDQLDPVFERFMSMITGFAPPPGPAGGPAEGHDHDHPAAGLRAAEFQRNYDLGPPHSLRGEPMFPNHRVNDHRHDMPHIHRTTIRSSPFTGGTASVTIYSGPMRRTRPVDEGRGRVPDPFQMMFSDLMHDAGPLPEDRANPPGQPPELGLQMRDVLLRMLNPANAMAGDAVYSQEALDRIITGLMEAHPQSNAAPPASDEALSNLDRRQITKETLGGEAKAECSICIDDLKEGETAVFLPCKHWFHESCVVLWLKEHNTCPICRTPIETRNRDGEGGRRGGGPGSNNDPSMPHLGPSSGSTGGSPGGAGGPSSPGLGGIHGMRATAGRNYHAYQGPGSNPAWTPPWNRDMYFDYGLGGDEGDAFGSPRGSAQQRQSAYRPPSQRQSRLNEALRSVAALQERRRERERRSGESSFARRSGNPAFARRSGDTASASTTGYDTSRLQRRNSLSPTSPRMAPGEQGARMRQRSPSQSNRASRTSQDSQRQQGHGPFSWLRDRFGGNRPSGNDSSRDSRRD